MNEDRFQAIYFSQRRRLVEAYLILNGRNIPSEVKYVGVIFDGKIILRLHTETIDAKAFRTFIRFHSLLKISD